MLESHEEDEGMVAGRSRQAGRTARQDHSVRLLSACLSLLSSFLFPFHSHEKQEKGEGALRIQRKDPEGKPHAGGGKGPSDASPSQGTPRTVTTRSQEGGMEVMLQSFQNKQLCHQLVEFWPLELWENKIPLFKAFLRQWITSALGN